MFKAIKQSWAMALGLGIWTVNLLFALTTVLPWHTAMSLSLLVPAVGVWVYALWLQHQVIISQNSLIAVKLETLKLRMDQDVMEAARFLITNTKVG